MKAVEFEATVAPGEHLRIVVMWEPSKLDLAWRAAGRRRFEAAYCAEDAIYDQLIDDPATR